MRRKKGGYFKQIKGAPDPLVVNVKKRVNFNEVDLIRIVWHGRYPLYFEEGSAELGRRFGLSFKDYYKANISAPIVQFHIDYFQPLVLDEEFIVKASFVWCEGARLNTEFSIIKQDKSIASTGFTVQMFLDTVSSEICIASPLLLEQFRSKWKSGKFK